MSCRHSQKWLINNYNSELIELPLSVQNHLNDCIHCQHIIQQLDTLNQKLEQLHNVSIPEKICQRMWPTVALNLQPPSFQRRYRTSWAISIPTLATAALMLALFFRISEREATPNTVTVSNQTQKSLYINNARIDGQEANLSIYEHNESRMTLIWLD
ncbi:hypothetical protein KAR48_08455 [bacterium]|nr:hypothetical protein [bacterium]